jgi:hypothetical protein
MSLRAGIAITCFLAAPIVFGEEASYRMTGGDTPVSASSNGFSQVVLATEDGGTEVRVATTLTPIGAEGTYGGVVAGDRPEVPDGFALPGALEKRLQPDLGAWQAATLVLEWAADRVSVDIDDEGAQDAVSVLERGRGRCSGLANASVALLRAAGFEARTVSGLLIGDDGPIPHRWVECRFPGAGWVASDPTLGLWTMTPRHVVFPDTVVNLPEVRVISASDDGLHRLPKHGGRLMRPNQGADLVCQLNPGWNQPDPVAVLRGSGGEIRRSSFEPEAHFSGLLPGRWILEINSGEMVVERHQIDLRSGDFRIYVVGNGGDQTKRGTGS